MTGPSKSARSRTAGSSLELLDEGFHLLRGMPLVAWSIYLAAVLPFAWLFLFFWFTMIHEAGSERLLVEWSALLTLGLLVMRLGQTWFFQALVARRSQRPLPRWGLRTLARAALEQSFWMGAGAIAIPLASLVMIPTPHVYSFFQYIMAASGRPAAEGGAEVRTAARLARAWGNADWKLLSLVSGFSVIVFFNWFLASQMGPGLLKSIFGIESAITRSGGWQAVAIFFPINLVLTFLVLDPLLKAAYALRWFYLRSQGSGEDLLVHLRTLPPVNRRESAGGLGLARLVILGLVLGGGLVCSATPLRAQEIPSEKQGATEEVVTTPEGEAFARAAKSVLTERRYAWRTPPGTERAVESEPGLITRFIDWLARLFAPDPPEFRPDEIGAPPTGILGPLLKILLYVLLAALAVIIVGLLVRGLAHSRAKAEAEPAEAPAAAKTVDVDDEMVTAADLPVSEWVVLARQHLAEGDYRKALRAYFLAQLAELADRGLLRLARFKSNRDYHREIERRAALLGDVPRAFGENVRLLEDCWYGTTPADAARVGRFEDNLRRMEVAV